MFSILPTDHLLGPRELHGAATPEQYLLQQRVSILEKRTRFPFLNWRLPFLHLGAPVPFKVSDSCWQLACPCGNYPSYAPEWALAACFSCGAIYRQAPPYDWRDVQRVLVNRAKLGERHMLIGQTVEELRAENRAHGEPD